MSGGTIRAALAVAVCGFTFAAMRPIAAQQPPVAPNVADQQGPQTPGAQGQRGNVGGEQRVLGGHLVFPFMDGTG